MKLTPSQERACRELEGAYKESRVGDVEGDVDGDVWFLLGHDVQEDPGLEDSDDEDPDDDLEDLVKEDDSGAKEVGLCIAENSVQQCIIDLLVSLFTHLPSGKDNKFYSPIFRFLVLFSYGPNGQWFSGRQISQVFAALLFCARELMWVLMYEKVAESPSMRYSESVVVFHFSNFLPCLLSYTSSEYITRFPPSWMMLGKDQYLRCT
jgi:hypothetical protein